MKTETIIKKIIFLSIVFICIFAFMRIVSLLDFNNNNLYTTGINYALQAAGFLKGSLALPIPTKFLIQDMIIFNGQVFVAFAPFPAILLMPLVMLFGPNLFSQIVLTFLASAASAVLIWQILAEFYLTRFQKTFSLIWFFFGSFYLFFFFRLSVWGLEHTIPITFVLAAILWSLKRKSLWGSGFLLAAATLARYPMIFYLPLIFYLHFFYRPVGKKRFFEIFYLILPILLAGLIVLIFNYLRFGDPLEVGHNLNLSTIINLSRDAPFGLFDFRYIFKNLVGFFFYPPLPVSLFNQIITNAHWRFFFWFSEPVPSFFISGLVPIIILLKTRWKSWLSLTALFVIFAIFSFTMIWFRLNSSYLADALPAFLILLAAILKEKRLSDGVWLRLVLFSVIFFAYWFLVIFWQNW